MQSTPAVHEPVLDPQQPIVDAHHHLWPATPLSGYPPFDARILVDTIQRSGHRVIATVYVEAGSAYRTSGPEHLRGAGETEYARDAAQVAGAADIHVVRGIVTNAKLELDPAQLRELLDAHQRHSGGRLRGVRRISAWDEEQSLRFEGFGMARGALADKRIHAALRVVAAAGLSFDAWMHFHQLGDLLVAADAVPELPIVLDHLGGVLLVGPYAGRRDEVFSSWKKSIDAVAKRSNIVVKLGGVFLGPAAQFDPSTGSSALVELCRPWFDHALERFGPERCMFESNFPVDGVHLSYNTLWNAFKRYAAPLSARERHALFVGTADRTYRLDLGDAS